MSTRADLFPPEYIDEFTKLQDQVPPVPFDGIRRLIEDPNWASRWISFLKASMRRPWPPHPWPRCTPPD
jgi:hypothetical protein